MVVNLFEVCVKYISRLHDLLGGLCSSTLTELETLAEEERHLEIPEIPARIKQFIGILLSSYDEGGRYAVIQQVMQKTIIEKQAINQCMIQDIMAIMNERIYEDELRQAIESSQLTEIEAETEEDLQKKEVWSSFTADVQYEPVCSGQTSKQGHFHRRFIMITRDNTLRVYKEKNEKQTWTCTIGKKSKMPCKLYSEPRELLELEIE